MADVRKSSDPSFLDNVLITAEAQGEAGASTSQTPGGPKRNTETYEFGVGVEAAYRKPGSKFGVGLTLNLGRYIEESRTLSGEKVFKIKDHDTCKLPLVPAGQGGIDFGGNTIDTDTQLPAKCDSLPHELTGWGMGGGLKVAYYPFDGGLRNLGFTVSAEAGGRSLTPSKKTREAIRGDSQEGNDPTQEGSDPAKIDDVSEFYTKGKIGAQWLGNIFGERAPWVQLELGAFLGTHSRNVGAYSPVEGIDTALAGFQEPTALNFGGYLNLGVVVANDAQKLDQQADAIERQRLGEAGLYQDVANKDYELHEAFNEILDIGHANAQDKLREQEKLSDFIPEVEGQIKNVKNTSVYSEDVFEDGEHDRIYFIQSLENLKRQAEAEQATLAGLPIVDNIDEPDPIGDEMVQVESDFTNLVSFKLAPLTRENYKTLLDGKGNPDKVRVAKFVETFTPDQLTSFSAFSVRESYAIQVDTQHQVLPKWVSLLPTISKIQKELSKSDLKPTKRGPYGKALQTLESQIKALDSLIPVIKKEVPLRQQALATAASEAKKIKIQLDSLKAPSSSIDLTHVNDSTRFDFGRVGVQNAPSGDNISVYVYSPEVNDGKVPCAVFSATNAILLDTSVFGPSGSPVQLRFVVSKVFPNNAQEVLGEKKITVNVVRAAQVRYLDATLPSIEPLPIIPTPTFDAAVPPPQHNGANPDERHVTDSAGVIASGSPGPVAGGSPRVAAVESGSKPEMGVASIGVGPAVGVAAPVSKSGTNYTVDVKATGSKVAVVVRHTSEGFSTGTQYQIYITPRGSDKLHAIALRPGQVPPTANGATKWVESLRFNFDIAKGNYDVVFQKDKDDPIKIPLTIEGAPAKKTTPKGAVRAEGMGDR